MPSPVIKFFAPVNEQTIQKLMTAVDEKVSAGASYEELQLLEKIKSLRVDMDNFAHVVAWGLVHEIRQELFPVGAEVVSISS
jgi:hypothetical protein